MNRRHMLWIALVLCCAYFAVHPARAAIVMGDVEPADPSEWTTFTRVYIGNTASGTLTLDSGTLTSNSAYIGNSSGTTGLVTISGAGSTWKPGSLYVGGSGSGVLSVTDGGSFGSGYYIYLGYAAGSAGSLTVSGSTCTAKSLVVGQSGSGTLDISHGGSVSGTNTVIVASGSGSSGAINFGPGGGTLTTKTLWASPAQLSGTGTINCRGLVSDVDLVFDSSHGLSQTVPGFGSVAVNLTPSSGGNLGAGYYGNGSLTITDGLVVSSSYGYLGYKPGSSGTATVDGPEANWHCYATYVGMYGSGTLNVTNQGSFSAGSQLYVGHDGTGTMNVTNGGSISTAYLSVGADGTLSFSGGAFGSVTADCGINATGTINFGPGGGTLTIRDTLFASPAQLSGTGTINCHGLVSDVDLVFDATHGLIQTAPGFGNVAVNLDISAGGVLAQVSLATAH